MRYNLAMLIIYSMPVVTCVNTRWIRGYVCTGCAKYSQVCQLQDHFSTTRHLKDTRFHRYMVPLLLWTTKTWQQHINSPKLLFFLLAPFCMPSQWQTHMKIHRGNSAILKLLYQLINPSMDKIWLYSQSLSIYYMIIS